MYFFLCLFFVCMDKYDTRAKKRRKRAVPCVVKPVVGFLFASVLFFMRVCVPCFEIIYREDCFSTFGLRRQRHRSMQRRSRARRGHT